MELTEDLIRETLARFFRRAEAIKIAGGIPLTDVADGREVPAGWVLDFETAFYIPPTFQFCDTNH